MKCEECQKSYAQWRCPQYRCYACDKCKKEADGRCTYCAPMYESVNKGK